MVTCVYNIKNNRIDETALNKCAEIILNGGLVAFPTETVYGLGCNAYDEEAVKRLYNAKKRPPVKPISLCVPNLSVAEQVAVFSEKAKALFDAFMPGPLTLVLPKRDCVPTIVTAGLDSVGIRLPSNPVALRLAELCGVPIALPSANLSGQGALTDGADVYEALNGRIDALIDGGKTEVGHESTILSLVDEPKIIRQGALPYDVLEPYIK
ncbi:MAG: threonylcarbamoyl-AMP synthase [Clostridia bacterium]|nr:threonylcarbamoyl-AMP synthase [Clostridia bacterium]